MVQVFCTLTVMVKVSWAAVPGIPAPLASTKSSHSPIARTGGGVMLMVIGLSSMRLKIILAATTSGMRRQVDILMLHLVMRSLLILYTVYGLRLTVPTHRRQCRSGFMMVGTGVTGTVLPSRQKPRTGHRLYRLLM